MAPKIPDLVTPQATLADRGGMYGRRVYLGDWSGIGPEQGHITLTPNAARTLVVEPLSIETLAGQILGDERIAPVRAGQGNTTREVSEELLEALTDTYREAASGKVGGSSR